ncbi:hypothetical protein BKG68_10305 [Mycobacteroides saopaulense]|uniref:Lipoprotein LpqH n=1 Tax=Mycobacteroides saopaulense TaxID=1578165 RepID=A0ABX3BYT0_9MYCO|nr:hypothetical protein BKG68_10305 [Mycobacteroides saopaulense]OHU08922.1 hypothetical protein BKG73_14995 [Mycobacteroides saopaulense]
MTSESLILLGIVASAAGVLAGCSADQSATGQSVGVAGGPTAPASKAKVTIGGVSYEVEGAVTCTAYEDDLVVVVGREPKAVKMQLTSGDSPAVSSVHLGTVGGFPLIYTEGVKQGDASATKAGKTYTVVGDAFGVDPADGGKPVTKPFRVELSCP